MFRKIFDWYMKQKMVYVLLAMYLTAATSATVLIPGGEGLILWVWGTGATVVAGPWLWSLNTITKQNTGKSLWDHG